MLKINKYQNLTLLIKRYLPTILISVVSLALILSSIRYFLYETNYSYYSFLFSFMSKKLILIRFLYSIFIRCILLILAIGLMLRIDFCRKLLIFYAFYTITTVAFKHPYNSFVNIFSYMIKTGATPPEMYSYVPNLIYYTYLITCIKTVCIWFVITYILTRTDIKATFTKEYSL